MPMPSTVRSTRTSGDARRGVGGVAEVATAHLNQVTVRGRLAAAAETRLLPSGDELATWRLVVNREVRAGARKVDVIDCSTLTARIRRQACAWSEGDVIDVSGALRRRFWRGPSGLQSRCEVDVTGAARHARAGGSPRAAKRVKRLRASG
jgi:single-strand DNA-binding protein